MNDTEKILIIDLFKKLKNIENETKNKDHEVEKLILQLSKSTNHAIYFMVQKILVQDLVIQELKNKLKEYKDKLYNQSKNVNFLNENLKKNVLHDSEIKNNNNISQPLFEKFRKTGLSNSDNFTTDKSNIFHSKESNSYTSNFLSNALQTALGVAGGMVAGNIITNLFNYNHHIDNTGHKNDLNNEYSADENSNSIKNIFLNSDTDNSNSSSVLVDDINSDSMENLEDDINDIDDVNDNIDDFDSNI
ncbi:DUF2076 family protein [Buchnera aphidicola]|uniref:DUF2076 family protein n=1 Tax=Buchnera aphidicola TaxID=9 RepID=UPI0031B85CB4